MRPQKLRHPRGIIVPQSRRQRAEKRSFVDEVEARWAVVPTEKISEDDPITEIRQCFRQALDCDW